MKIIELSNGTRIRVSDEDHARLSQYNWSQFTNGRAYRREKIPPAERTGAQEYQAVLMHRDIMGVNVGDPRKVIFRDGDPTNCTRGNLVIKPPRFRSRHRGKPRGSSRFRGVGWNKAKGKWQAYLRINGKLKHLGFFPGPEGERKAALAYDRVAREHFGDLAVLNFPKQKRRRRAAERDPAVATPAVAAKAPARTPVVKKPAETRPTAPRPAEKFVPASAPASAPAESRAEALLSRPPQELDPEDFEWLKARFLGEKYRGGRVSGAGRRR